MSKLHSPLQQSVRVRQGWYRRWQTRCRQIALPHTPLQQSVLFPHPPPTSPQPVSQRLPVQRLLQQSLSSRQRWPGSRHTTWQNPVSPQRLPSQHQLGPKQRPPGPRHPSELRQVPAVQFIEQQAELVRQLPPLATQAGGAWQVPAVQVSPAQHPSPQGAPATAQTLAARQVPDTQRTPAQHSPSKTQARPSGRQPQTPALQSM